MRPGKNGAPRNGQAASTSVPPLTGTLERLSGTEDGMDLSARLGVPDEPGWTTVVDLAEDPGALDEIVSRIGRGYAVENRAFAGTTLLRGYLWRMLTPAVAVFLTERRLPDLRAANVALRFGEGGSAEGVAFVGSRFAALPDDPDAAHPDATVLSPEGELLGWLRDALVETHLPVLIPALRSLRVRRGARALRSVYVDSCAEAFMFVGRELGQEAEARGFAEVLLAGPSPLSGPTNFYVQEHEGGYKWTRVRNTCCLYYKVGGGACFTCPRVTHAERLQRQEGE